jgi:hypothetical protein
MLAARITKVTAAMQPGNLSMGNTPLSDIGPIVTYIGQEWERLETLLLP